MNSEINDILFLYLKNALYGTAQEHLDISCLPPAYQKLGEGIVQTADWIEETRVFACEIAKGNLDVQTPSPENMISAPLKALQGSLRHLTWQTQQIAKGDYNQQVDFMGTFSDSFNSMILQLKERTRALDVQIEYLHRSNDMMELLAENTQECILVISVLDGSILFENKRMKQQNLFDSDQKYIRFQSHCPSIRTQGNLSWEYETDDRRFFSVESVCTGWHDEEVWVHFLVDISEAKNRERDLEAIAFKDELTGTYNRRYSIVSMESLHDSGRCFSLVFVDIDFLKYCNDQFGHEAGDAYIRNVIDVLNRLPWEKKVCRMGGDEFMVLIPDHPASRIEQSVKEARQQLITQRIGGEGELYQSFSYGIVDNFADPHMDVGTLLSIADQRMYQYKQQNKEKCVLSDSRSTHPNR